MTLNSVEDFWDWDVVKNNNKEKQEKLRSHFWYDHSLIKEVDFCQEKINNFFNIIKSVKMSTWFENRMRSFAC